MDNLQLRLRNCIQTILELEPELGIGNGIFFKDEFISLKQYLGCIDSMALAEEDVAQLESATSEFLADLKCIYSRNMKKRHVLQ